MFMPYSEAAFGTIRPELFVKDSTVESDIDKSACLVNHSERKSRSELQIHSQINLYFIFSGWSQ